MLAVGGGMVVSALGETRADEVPPEEGRFAWWLLDRSGDTSMRARGPTTPRTTLDLGGSIREHYEAYRNFELAADPGRRGWDDYTLHRLLVFADVRIDDRYRVRAEFGNSLIAGNERPTSPVDEDEAYIHQAFGEVGFGDVLGSSGSGFRLGRQELAFGSGRLFSLRDGPNIRRSFDGARLMLSLGSTTADAFIGSEVQIRPGVINNRPDDAVVSWGLYTSSRNFVGGMNLDSYYLGIDRVRAVFDAGAARETRHSVGMRFWGDVGVVDYNFEPVVQFGSFGDHDILAWTIASDTGVRLGRGDRAPRLGLRGNIISGGHSDHELNTFNALFPNNSYFSEAAIIAPANLVDLNPTATIHPDENVALRFMWDFLCRYDIGDAVYVPPGVPLIAGDSSDERFIGHSLSIAAEWQVRDRLTFFAAYPHFRAGPVVTDAGGEGLDYFLIGVDWSF